jgi:hypothetical protein
LEYAKVISQPFIIHGFYFLKIFIYSFPKTIQKPCRAKPRITRVSGKLSFTKSRLFFPTTSYHYIIKIWKYNIEGHAFLENLRRGERKPGESEGGCEEKGKEEGGCGKQNRSRKGSVKNAPAFISLYPLPNFSIILPILMRILYQFILSLHQFSSFLP